MISDPNPTTSTPIESTARSVRLGSNPHLGNPHPIELNVRIYGLGTLAAADWLREVACLLWDSIPDHQSGCLSLLPDFDYRDCDCGGKRDPAEHLRRMIALWAAVHGRTPKWPPKG